MICYIGMGWSAIFAIKTIIKAVPTAGLLYILFGGIAYTIGAIIYGVGKKHHIMHSVFHILCIIGTVLQFVGIYFYVI